MSVSNDKIEKYLKLAKKKPQYYAKLGDLYSDEGDFKTATTYYQKPSTTAFWHILFLATLWATALNTKKRRRLYGGRKQRRSECFARLGFCYETGYVKSIFKKQSNVTPKPPIWVSRQQQDLSAICIISILRLKILRLKTLKMR